MSLERPLIAAKQSRVMQCLFGQPRGTDGGKQPHAQPRRASLLPETSTSIFLLISLERVFRLRFLLAIEERAMSWMSCLKSSLNGGRPELLVSRRTWTVRSTQYMQAGTRGRQMTHPHPAPRGRGKGDSAIQYGRQ
jgi:hypothetical protein